MAEGARSAFPLDPEWLRRSIARIRAIVSSNRTSTDSENSTLCWEPPARTTTPVGWPNLIDLLHQQTLRCNLQDVRLVQSPRHRFLLDWNQRLSNSNQLIRSTDQPISTRAQSWCALSGLIRRLDGSTAEADLRTLPPDSSGPAVHKTASTTIWLYVADRIGSDSFWLCVADAQGIVINSQGGVVSLAQ